MSIFDRFESAVERGVNGAFSRVFRSGIKPVDITTAIRRTMDESVQEVSASRIIAANHFTVYASRTDLSSLKASLDVLADEFAQQATEHASANSYSLLGPVTIEFINLLLKISQMRILNFYPLRNLANNELFLRFILQNGGIEYLKNYYQLQEYLHQLVYMQYQH